MEQHTKKTKNNLKASLLKQIEQEKVVPRSRLFFRCQECFVWTLWLLSVLVGALAVAISLFVVTHHQYALYEATHDNFLTFMVSVLPYLWIIIFATMVGVAVYNMRHTKRGYRYSIVTILASSIVLSFAAGSTMQYFGLGYSLDSLFGKQMSMYMSQAKIEKQLWQAPHDGRLIGQQVLATTAPTTTVIFQDSAGDRWVLNVSELTSMDLYLLGSEQTVRLLGTASDSTAKHFHACGVFPWVLGQAMKASELSKERQAFISRVYDHKDRSKERLAKLELAVFEETDEPSVEEAEGVCAHIAPVRRIEASMH